MKRNPEIELQRYNRAVTTQRKVREAVTHQHKAQQITTEKIILRPKIIPEINQHAIIKMTERKISVLKPTSKSILNTVEKIKVTPQNTRYWNDVRRLTRMKPIHTLQNAHKIKFRRYDVDHIVSISDGYKYNIPPQWIAHISNLRVITHKKNYKKGRASDQEHLNNMLKRLFEQIQ